MKVYGISPTQTLNSAELKDSGLIHSAWIDKDRIHCKRTNDAAARNGDT